MGKPARTVSDVVRFQLHFLLYGMNDRECVYMFLHVFFQQSQLIWSIDALESAVVKEANYESSS